MSINKINQYRCDYCGGVITTIDRAEGMTPASVACRATSGCTGAMHSQMYTVDQSLTPDFEWVKHEGKRKRLGRDMREYVAECYERMLRASRVFDRAQEAYEKAKDDLTKAEGSLSSYLHRSLIFGGPVKGRADLPEDERDAR